jgi:hypothetical protein
MEKTVGMRHDAIFGRSNWRGSKQTKKIISRTECGRQTTLRRESKNQRNDLMKMSAKKAALVAGFLAGAMSAAQAEAVKFEAPVSQKEAIKLDFADGSKHFFLLVRREGKSEGQGPLADASVTEYGAHDIVPGVGGEPRGYLEFANADGDKAYIKWTIQAVFVPGPDGKPKLLDNGVWQVVSGTGKLAKLKGAGTFHLVPTGPTDRRFFLEGELDQ